MTPSHRNAVLRRLPAHVAMIHDFPYFARSPLLPVPIMGDKLWNRRIRDWIVI